MDASLLLLAFWAYQTSRLPKQMEPLKFEPIVIPPEAAPAAAQAISACIAAVAFF